MPVTVVRNNEVAEYTFVPKEFAEALISTEYVLGNWLSYDDNDENLKLKIELNTDASRHENAEYRLTMKDLIGGRHHTVESLCAQLGVPHCGVTETHYDYCLNDDTYAYSKIKYEYFWSPDFTVRASKNYSSGVRQAIGRVEFGLSNVRQVLYNGHLLRKHTGKVYVVEGEKCAEALGSLGLLAVTAVNGAQSWREEFADTLATYPGIVIVPDNDESGQTYLKRVAETLLSTGCSGVYALTLPDAHDVADWIEAGHPLEAFNALAAVKLKREDYPYVRQEDRPTKPVIPPEDDEAPSSECVQEWLDALPDEYATHRVLWFRVFCALQSWSNDYPEVDERDAFQLFDTFSQRGGKKYPGRAALREKWESDNKGENSDGERLRVWSLKALAREHGWTAAASAKTNFSALVPTLEKIRELLPTLPIERVTDRTLRMEVLFALRDWQTASGTEEVQVMAIFDTFSQGGFHAMEDPPESYPGLDVIKHEWRHEPVKSDASKHKITFHSLYKWQVPVPPSAGKSTSSQRPAGSPKYWLECDSLMEDPEALMKQLVENDLFKLAKSEYQIRNRISDIPIKDSNVTYERETIKPCGVKYLAEFLCHGKFFLRCHEATDRHSEIYVKRERTNLISFMTEYPADCKYTIPEVTKIVFDPGLPPKLNPGFYNTFQGWTVEPKPCDTSEYWEHVRTIVCTKPDGSPDEKAYTMFRKWTSKMFQTPHDKAKVCLFLLAEKQGSGRSTIVAPIRAIMDGYVVAEPTWDDILGDKNAIIDSKILINVVDQPAPRDISSFKSLVTELMCRIRDMRCTTVSSASAHWILIEAQRSDSAPMEASDRRTYTIETIAPNRTPEEGRIFIEECIRKYRKFMTREFLSGLLYDFLNEDLTGYNFVAETQERVANESRSIATQNDGLVQYLYHVLSNGHWSIGTKKFSSQVVGCEIESDPDKPFSTREKLDANGNKIPIYADGIGDYWCNSHNGFIGHKEQFDFYKQFCESKRYELKQLNSTALKNAMISTFSKVGYVLTPGQQVANKGKRGFFYPSWKEMAKFLCKIVGEEDYDE